MPRITIKRAFGQRNVFQGEALIATIHDHRHNPERRAAGTQVYDNWNVCWRNGRVDWHETYSEARDNALKGQ